MPAGGCAADVQEFGAGSVLWEISEPDAEWIGRLVNNTEEAVIVIDL